MNKNLVDSGAKKRVSELELFRSRLCNIINTRHPLCRLADSIDWSAFHGNPYDGHTLNKTLRSAEKNIERIGNLSDVYVDLGYRKHDYTGEANVHIVGRSWRTLSRSSRRWYNRRSVIEADIGHFKNEHRLYRNYLKGKRGDQINVVLSACGYNLRTIYRCITAIFLFLSDFYRKIPNIINSFKDQLHIVRQIAYLYPMYNL